MLGERIEVVLESGNIEKDKLANMINAYNSNEIKNQDVLERLVMSCYFSKEFDHCYAEFKTIIEKFNRDVALHAEENSEYYRTCRINNLFMCAIYLTGGYTLTCVNKSAIDGLGKFVLTAGIIGISMVAQKKTNNYKNSNKIRQERKLVNRDAYLFKDRMITDYMLMSENFNYCFKYLLGDEELICLLGSVPNRDFIIDEFYNQHLDLLKETKKK